MLDGWAATSGSRARKRSAPSGGGELGAEDLDGDLAVVLEVVREVDRGHAALAELALEPIAVGQCRREAIQRGHFGWAGKNRSGSRL